MFLIVIITAKPMTIKAYAIQTIIRSSRLPLEPDVLPCTAAMMTMIINQAEAI